MTPPRSFTNRILLNFVVLFSVFSPTKSQCSGLGDRTATKLASAIEKSVTNGIPSGSSHVWGARVNIPSAISGATRDERVSFDSPFVFYEERVVRARIPMVHLVAVFHTQTGGEEGHMASYVATTVTTPGRVPQDWAVTAKLTSRGSMGYLHPHPDGTQIFYAYEIESKSGNTVAVRLYPNISNLKTNDYWRREVQLERKVSFPSENGDVGKKMVRNIGTPSISNVSADPSGTQISIRFHFYTKGDNPTDNGEIVTVTVTCRILSKQKQMKPRLVQRKCQWDEGSCNDNAKSIADCCPVACGMC